MNLLTLPGLWQLNRRWLRRHWVADPVSRRRFWASVSAYGWRPEQVHAKLGVRSLWQYRGSMDDALRRVLQTPPGAGRSLNQKRAEAALRRHMRLL